MAVRLIVRAGTSDPRGELRPGDRLWLVPWDLDGNGKDAVGLPDLMCAGRRARTT